MVHTGDERIESSAIDNESNYLSRNLISAHHLGERKRQLKCGSMFLSSDEGKIVRNSVTVNDSVNEKKMM